MTPKNSGDQSAGQPRAGGSPAAPDAPGSADARDAPGAPDAPDTPDAATYENARDELAQVVSKLEAGGLSLDESLTLWERGEELAARCGRFLDGARARVDAALSRADSGTEQN